MMEGEAPSRGGAQPRSIAVGVGGLCDNGTREEDLDVETDTPSRDSVIIWR